MIELILLIIRLFNQEKKPPMPRPPLNLPPGYPGVPQGSPRVAPPPPLFPRRTVRRPPPLPLQSIAIAQPIMTRSSAVSSAQPTPPPAVAKAAKPAISTAPQASANVLAIRNWLTPATLRQQFLLTEILQPPLALRDESAQRISTVI
jgi:hypothetical protein